MTEEQQRQTPVPLLARVKGILLAPREEWSRIAEEQADAPGIYARWVMPLAAVPAVCSAAGGLIFGHSLMGLTYRPGIGEALSTAFVGYMLTLLQVFVLAEIIDVLAPRFGGTPNRLQALKVAAYGMTASWLAGVFQLVPGLSMLALLGAAYGIYLVYLGLPPLMRAPAANGARYTATTIVAAVLLGVIISVVTTAVAATLGEDDHTNTYQGRIIEQARDASDDSGRCNATGSRFVAQTAARVAQR